MTCRHFRPRPQESDENRNYLCFVRDYSSEQVEVSMTIPPLSPDEALLWTKDAMARAASQEIARVRYEQRLSWAYGQAKFRHPWITREDIQDITDSTDSIIRSNTT